MHLHNTYDIEHILSRVLAFRIIDLRVVSGHTGSQQLVTSLVWILIVIIERFELLLPMTHYRSVDSGLKLASLPEGPSKDYTDVASMDELTTSELNRLITHESRNEVDSGNDIGHVLSFIFKSFKGHLPAADTLRHTDSSLLYDSTTQSWPLALPVQGQSIEKTFPLFLNSLNKALAKSILSGTDCTLPPLWYGSRATKPVGDDVIQRKPDLCLSNKVELEWSNILVVAELTQSHYSPAERAGKTLDTKAWLIFRQQPWRRFVLCLSFCKEYHELRVHIYDHSGGIVTRPVDIHQEPDKFRYIMACIVYGTRDCIGFDSTMFINPTQSPSSALWDRNVKNLSRRKKKVTKDNHRSESHVRHEPHTMDPYIEYLTSPPSSTGPPHADDEPPSPLPSSSSSDTVIGKMKVNEHEYDLLKVLFSGQGLVGRGTVCYLARRDGEEYIIKDHWVKNSRNGEVDAQEKMNIVMSEVEMLEAMKDVPGVPKLVEFWLVEVTPDQPDDTQLYRQKIHNSTMGMYRTHVRLVLKPKARRLQEFRSRKELVRTLRDIALSELTVERARS